MSVWAVLVAAGRGERLGADLPKAFVKLGELPLLGEPLRRLDESDWIDCIVVVAPPDWEEPAILLAEEIGAGKVRAVVTGGETRVDSVRRGVAEVSDEALVVLVHDAARPLVSDAVLERVLAPLAEGWDGADQADPRRCRRGDRLAGRARRGSDAPSVPRRDAPRRAHPK
jgi:2-C-methyl-D-erythritol 4-phosphate cytidylyltransferase